MNVKVVQLSNVLGQGGQSILNGGRGPFAMVQGHIGDDLLQWLQEEVAQASLGVSFKPKDSGKDRAVENQVKMEIAGHFEGHCLD
jgi:hypothetical protein